MSGRSGRERGLGGSSRAHILSLALLFPALALATPPPDAGTPDDTEDAGWVDTTGLAGLPPASPISFKAALQKTTVTLGEPFSLAIEVRHIPSEKYSLPVHLDLGDFGIRDHKIETRGEDPKITVIRLTLQAFKTGDQNIPPIRLAVDTDKGAEQLEIPPQEIKVAGVIDDSQGKPSMKEDTRALPTRYRWILWPVWVLLVLLVAGGIYLAVRLWKGKEAAGPPPKPRLPPFDEVLLRLVELENENLVGKGLRQTYYFRLSEILRDYFGRRYGFESLELTTDELLDKLRRRSTPGLDYDGLARFLRESDLVKFAKSDPSDGDCKLILDDARAMVLRTKPVLEPALQPGQPEGRPG